MPKKQAVPAPPQDLRDACVVAAREAIAEHGIENHSLRDVARRLGVSHQAPYKHYPSRDHLLAEVMRRCFENFAAHLDARRRFEAPRDDLRSLGLQYLNYAQEHPLEYRLMFGAPWPASAEHPDLIRDAVHAFDILREVLRRVHGSAASKREQVDLDARFIWSSMHGLAGVLQGDCLSRLALRPGVLARATEHVMAMVGRGLDFRT